MYGSMRCTYCKSEKITLSNGEYVCTSCGTVLGPELVAPIVVVNLQPSRKSRQIVIKLAEEKRETVRIRYGELVRYYIGKAALSFPQSQEVEKIAIALFEKVDKLKIQGKSPRVVAAALVYLALEKLGQDIPKQKIGDILKVSKYTIRDTIPKLRKYVASK